MRLPPPQTAIAGGSRVRGPTGMLVGVGCRGVCLSAIANGETPYSRRCLRSNTAPFVRAARLDQHAIFQWFDRHLWLSPG